MLVSLRTFTEARKKISSLSTGYGSERLQRAIVTLVLSSSWVIILHEYYTASSCYELYTTGGGYMRYMRVCTGTDPRESRMSSCVQR